MKIKIPNLLIALTILSHIGFSQSIDENFIFEFTQAPAITSFSVQDNGKIVLTGEFDIIQNDILSFNDRAVFRLNSDGTIDNTFQLGDFEFGCCNNQVLSVNNQTYLINTENLIRLNEDGSVDSEFQLDQNLFSNNGQILINELSIRGEFIYVLSNLRNQLIKLNSDGSIDNSFTPPTVPAVFVLDLIELKIQSDGKPVVLFKDSITRYNLDGSIDESFAVSNLITGFNSSRDRDVNLGIDSSNDSSAIIVGAVNSLGGQSASNVVRLLENGELDPTFTDNYNEINIDNRSIADLLVLSDGRILILARLEAGNNELGGSEGVLYMVNRDGTLVSSFIPVEMNLLASLNGLQFSSIATNNDESIFYVAGNIGSPNDLTDQGFFAVDLSGSVISFPSLRIRDRARVSKSRLLSNGQDVIVLGGFSDINGTPTSPLSKVNLNSRSIDPSFNISIDLFPERQISDFELLPNNRTLVSVNNIINSSLELIRLNEDGTVDNTFQLSDELGNIRLREIAVDNTGINLVADPFRSGFIFGSDTLGFLRMDLDGNFDLEESIRINSLSDTNPASVDLTTEGIVVGFRSGQFFNINLTNGNTTEIVTDGIAFDPNYSFIISDSTMISGTINLGSPNNLFILSLNGGPPTELPFEFSFGSISGGSFDNAILINQNTLLVSGGFTRIDEIRVDRMAMIDLENMTVYDPTLFELDVLGGTSDIEKTSDSTVLILGSFLSVGGVETISMAQLITNTTLAPPSSLSLIIQSLDSVTLEFVDNSAQETSFIVERAVNGSDFEFFMELAQNDTSFFDTSLAMGAEYTYRVAARNSLQTSDFSNEVAITAVVSIEREITQDQIIQWYPNPADDLITLSAKGIRSVTFQNISGKIIDVVKLESFNKETLELNVSSLKPGLYMLKFELGDGFQTEKLLIQR